MDCVWGKKLDCVWEKIETGFFFKKSAYVQVSRKGINLGDNKKICLFSSHLNNRQGDIIVFCYSSGYNFLVCAVLPSICGHSWKHH